MTEDYETLRLTLERAGLTPAQFADVWGIHELTAHRYLLDPATSKHAIRPPAWALRAAWLFEMNRDALKMMAVRFKMRPAPKPRGQPASLSGSEAPARKRGRPRKASTA